MRAFTTMRTGAAGLAAALAGNALIGYARDSLHWAAGLSETAQQIGVTVEQLQSLRLAAEQNGASVEGLERAMGILNRTLGQAQAGLPAAVQAFQRIGISKEQLRSFRNGGEALQAVITALSNLRNPAQQAAAAQALFGRGARELMVMLTQGAGAMARWTEQARQAGIITDEQARKADEAEDALGRLATTIRASLAGALADAMPGILAIIDALGRLAVIAIRVIGLLGQLTGGGTAGFSGSASSTPLLRAGLRQAYEDRWRQLGSPRRGTAEWRQAIADPQLRRLHAANRRAMGLGNEEAAQPPTGNVDLDMRPTGGGRHRRDDSARRAHEFDQQQRQLQIDALRAQAESTEALDERNEIQGRIASLENQQWLADLQFRQSQGEINQAQASRLIGLKNQLIYQEALGRALEYNHHVQEQENELADRREAIAQERLRADADMAETAQERRRIELELLRLTYEARRNALNRIIAENRDPHEVAKAQLEMSNLPGMMGRERAQILRNTRGPLESFMADLPDTAAKLNEALQNVATSGLQAITDGLTDVITGARKMKDVFKSVVASIISDLLRIQLQRAIIGPLTNVLSGLFGGIGGLGGDAGTLAWANPFGGARAAGGPVLPGRTYLVGENGPELLSMGGGGGHVIANDNIGGGGGDVHLHQTYTFQGVAITKEEFVQGLMAAKYDTIHAINQTRRRSP